MLPLWIIDIREQSARRDDFQSLLRQIDHVYMPSNTPVDSRDPSSANDNEEFDFLSGLTGGEIKIAGEANNYSDDVSDPEKAKEILREVIDRHDRLEADRNACIQGYYWYYSLLEPSNFNTDFSPDLDLSSEQSTNHANKTAAEFYRFQNEMVAEGQRFIKTLRQSNARADIKINVVVLGDLSEKFTRLVFPSIAGLLQKEKGRILPHHIHQGMEMIGMLYMPSDMNHQEVPKRKSMLRTLREIDVQHRVNELRGYDHMMFYQDVPNRTERAYTMLSDKAVAEYLLQCLVHLYLASSDSHPLISGTTSADVFYFSMGATSVHFDTRHEDQKTRYLMVNEVIRQLKSEGTNELFSDQLRLLEKNEYAPETFFRYQSLSQLDENPDEDDEEEMPNPHPIRDFFARNLKRYYYNSFLRYFSTNLMRRITNTIEQRTRNALDTVATESRRTYTNASKLLFERIRDMFGKLTSSEGGIPAIANMLKELQAQLANQRKRVRTAIDQNFWRKIEENYVPRRMADDFIDYHEAFLSDQRGNSGDTEQLELKKQAVKDLNSILSREPTMLSRICRCILLGIVGAIAGVPVLGLLSLTVVDLGNVYANRLWWGIVLFLLPAGLQLISYLRYLRAKRRAVKKLEAMFLHDAYARVANRIESEINSFYDKLSALASKYLKRCEQIRKEIGKDITEDKAARPLFPKTMFNQPLIGGVFGIDSLLPPEEANDTEIRINYIHYPFNKVGSPEYFIFINQNKKIFGDLFRDVKVPESLIRRIDDNGEEVLITKEQQENELEDLWQKHIQTFNNQLNEVVADAILPRENSTVGEKLMQYCRSGADRGDTMRPVVEFATINGEITSSSDREYADLKLNDARVESVVFPFLSTTSKISQTDRYNHDYSRYIFITRWRCFEHLNLNRLFPMEDFDEEVHIQMVYEEEVKSKNEKRKGKGKRKDESYDTTPHSPESDNSKGLKYSPRPSSLLLWALCMESSSTEWFRLFNSEQFAKAYSDKLIYRSYLNQND